MPTGYIYKLYTENKPDLIYYGSTQQPLRKRLAEHVKRFKFYKIHQTRGYITAFDILKEGSYKIDLLETIEFDNKIELLELEANYIKNNKCVNKYIPGRTASQYYKDHIDFYKNYYRENRPLIYKRNIIHWLNTKKQNNVRETTIKKYDLKYDENADKWT